MDKKTASQPAAAVSPVAPAASANSITIESGDVEAFKRVLDIATKGFPDDSIKNFAAKMRAKIK